MNDIEDAYKLEVESLDREFLEELKKGKDKKEVISNYEQKLQKAIEKFSKEYPHLTPEEQGIQKKVKKKEKELGHLEVTPFSFEFNNYEKFAMKKDFLLFMASRKWHRFIKFLPRPLLYTYYKIVWTTRATYHSFVERIEALAHSTKQLIITISLKLWNFTKKIYSFLKKRFLASKNFILPKLLFWKKKDETTPTDETKESAPANKKTPPTTTDSPLEETKPAEENAQ